MFTEVIIGCPKHGEFNQTPVNHLAGKGCNQCGRVKNSKKQSKGKEAFVRQAKEKFGDIFNYKKVIYVNQSTVVEIGCPKHGQLSITPKSFLKSPYGCKNCRPLRIREEVVARLVKGNAKLKSGLKRHAFSVPQTTAEFISIAQKIHGSRYDYSTVKYKNLTTNVDIVCPIHGAFSQRPSSHLSNGAGCLKCSRGSSQRLTQKGFIARANLVHNSKYTYENTKYVNNHTSVIVTCPHHGDFSTNPNNHIRSKEPVGCRECANKKMREERTSSKPDFIEKAVLIHGSQYSYESVIYINARKKVIITCKSHGDFSQEPDVHLRGVGCPSCGREIVNIGSTINDYLQSEHRFNSYFYFLHIYRDNEEFLKVGITTKKLSHRFAPSAMPYNYTPIFFKEFDIAEAYTLEQMVLETFKEKYHYWPQLDFGGRTECFKIEAKVEVINFLNQHMGSNQSSA